MSATNRTIKYTMFRAFQLMVTQASDRIHDGWTSMIRYDIVLIAALQHHAAEAGRYR